MTGWSTSREAEVSTYRSIYHPGLAKPRPPLLQKEGSYVSRFGA